MSNKQEKFLTERIVTSNVLSVRNQIYQKHGYSPYYATAEDATSVVTDMDHFPYTRFYRGNPKSTEPIIMEREAGWRPQRDDCYTVNSCSKPAKYPNHCFESACTTVYPCYPEYANKYMHKGGLNTQINRSCVVQYR